MNNLFKKITSFFIHALFLVYIGGFIFYIINFIFRDNAISTSNINNISKILFTTITLILLVITQYHVIKIYHSSKHSPFSLENANRIFTISYSFLAITILRVLVESLNPNNTQGAITLFDIGFFRIIFTFETTVFTMATLVLLIISDIYKKSVLIKQEYDLTI